MEYSDILNTEAAQDRAFLYQEEVPEWTSAWPRRDTGHAILPSRLLEVPVAVDQSLPSQISALLLKWPHHVDNIHLEGGGAAKTVTIPSNAVVVIFSPCPKSADFLVNTVGQTAARPTADVVDGSASLPNPTSLRDLEPGETFSIIAGAVTVDVALIWKRAPRTV